MYAGDFYPVLFCMLKLISFDCESIFIYKTQLFFFDFLSGAGVPWVKDLLWWWWWWCCGTLLVCLGV